MKEDEIMFALERCASMDSGHCIRCPLFGDPLCRKTLAKNALTLINQKNEKLRGKENAE